MNKGLFTKKLVACFAIAAAVGAAAIGNTSAYAFDDDANPDNQVTAVQMQASSVRKATSPSSVLQGFAKVVADSEREKGRLYNTAKVGARHRVVYEKVAEKSISFPSADGKTRFIFTQKT